MSVVRLVTHARLVAHTPTSFTVALRHVALLEDGRELMLLDDRGFSGDPQSPTVVGAREQIELDARTCVGPDEPVGAETWARAEASHRRLIAARLRQAGVTIGADDVGRLAHEVVLDEGLRGAVAPG